MEAPERGLVNQGASQLSLGYGAHKVGDGRVCAIHRPNREAVGRQLTKSLLLKVETAEHHPGGNGLLFTRSP